MRNGYHPERDIQTGIGPITAKIPKARAKDGQPVTFRSTLIAPYVRKMASLEAALPWLHLKGVSTGERPKRVSYPGEPAAPSLTAKEQYQILSCPPPSEAVINNAAKSRFYWSTHNYAYGA